MRYHVAVIDRAGKEVEHHRAEQKAEASELAAMLRRRYPRYSVVIFDDQRDGQVVDEDEEP